MLAYALVSKPCSEATDRMLWSSSISVSWLFKKIKGFQGKFEMKNKVFHKKNII